MTCSALDIPGDPAIPPAILVTVKDLSQYGLVDGDTVHLYWWALHSTSGDEEVIAWDEPIELGEDYWNGVVHTARTFTSKVLPADLIIEVGTEYLLHGRPTLHYEVQIYNGETGRSKVLQLTIDREPPALGGDEGMLVFPDEVLNNGVTAQYLALNGDKLEALVPDYKVLAVGDTITYFWNRKLNDEEYAGERTLNLADIGQPVKLVFDGQMIRDREDGVRYAYYRIKDRAGNQSPRARIVDLDVAAEIVPRQLPWPELPKASGTGATLTLDLKALTGDLFGVLPEEAEVYPQDTLVLQWGEPGGRWNTLMRVRIAMFSTFSLRSCTCGISCRLK